MTGSGHGKRRTLTGLWLAAALCWCAASGAQPSADDLARKHFESGVAYLQESDYDNALKAFEKAYELSKREEILLNIATVHERTGNLRQAVTALERYLAEAPKGEHTETVQIRIRNLKKRIDEQGTAPTPTPTPKPDPVAPATAPTRPTPPVADKPPESKAPNRIPAYISFGLGGVAAAGAVLTGVLAQAEYDDAKTKCSPNCTDDDISSGKTLALTSTVLTGVAVVGVGIGTILLLTDSSGSEKRANHKSPGFAVSVGPGGGMARAAWAF